MPTGADRDSRRTYTPLRILSEDLLDHAIFKRVIADDDDSSTWPEPADCRAKTSLEDAELIVDLDSERLKDAPGRMAPASACRGGYGVLHDLDEL